MVDGRSFSQEKDVILWMIFRQGIGYIPLKPGRTMLVIWLYLSNSVCSKILIYYYKTMEKIILGVAEKRLKDNMVIGHSQHRFVKRRFCLMKLISFYDKVILIITSTCKRSQQNYSLYSKCCIEFSFSMIIYRHSNSSVH